MTSDSVYNDPDHVFDISSVPAWKSPPLHGAYAPNARLSPRAKAGIAAGGVILAASGMFAWSSYSTAQADADIKKAQIALDASRLDLERQKQAAAAATSAGQETAAEKARREAVEACVAKTNGAFGAVADCGKAFPATGTLGMTNTAATVGSDGDSNSPSSGVGLVVIGSVGAVVAVGWAKKRFARM